jgi:hypothetical protein
MVITAGEGEGHLTQGDFPHGSRGKRQDPMPHIYLGDWRKDKRDWKTPVRRTTEVEGRQSS